MAIGSYGELMNAVGGTRRLAVAGATGLIGAQVVDLARAAGHEIVPLSRSCGVDLTDRTAIGDRLNGVDAVIDVTRASTMDTDKAVEFFTTVAKNLGQAAAAAGVPRTVVLSIVGIDQSQDYGWYIATLAHEDATRAYAPGARVLRATQFHEFPEQILGWSRRNGRAEIMDMPTQPVASAEVARQLLQMATDIGEHDHDIAGPKPERLVDLVRRMITLTGDDVEVVPGEVPETMARGSALPGPGALRRGVDWQTWATSTYR